MFSCKYAAYFQNSFLQEHPRGAACELFYKINSFIVVFQGFLKNLQFYYKINSFIVVLRGFLDSNGLIIIFKILEDVFSEHFSGAAFQIWQ